MLVVLNAFVELITYIPILRSTLANYVNHVVPQLDLHLFVILCYLAVVETDVVCLGLQIFLFLEDTVECREEDMDLDREMQDGSLSSHFLCLI